MWEELKISGGECTVVNFPLKQFTSCNNYLPVPSEVFKLLLKTSPDTDMLFARFGCTQPPPPVPPFLLTQNLSPKDIAGSDIMKLKVS